MNMGDMSEGVQEGLFCGVCCGLMEDLIPENGGKLLDSPGHPRVCEMCQEDCSSCGRKLSWLEIDMDICNDCHRKKK